jgi:hypothetical protein
MNRHRLEWIAIYAALIIILVIMMLWIETW